MTTWIALLRAVNLGPRNKVAMADLRALLESLGYGDVRTYVQSGNAVFTAPARGAAAVRTKIETALRDDLGVDTAVILRTAAELDRVVEGNPFPARKAVAPKELHVVFLAQQPKRAVDLAAYAPDEVEAGDRVLYVRLPNGVQGTRLPDWTKALGVPATMRTWNTVTRLRDLSSPPGAAAS